MIELILFHDLSIKLGEKIIDLFAYSRTIIISDKLNRHVSHGIPIELFYQGNI